MVMKSAWLPGAIALLILATGVSKATPVITDGLVAAYEVGGNVTSRTSFAFRERPTTGMARKNLLRGLPNGPGLRWD